MIYCIITYIGPGNQEGDGRDAGQDERPEPDARGVGAFHQLFRRSPAQKEGGGCAPEVVEDHSSLQHVFFILSIVDEQRNNFANFVTLGRVFVSLKGLVHIILGIVIEKCLILRFDIILLK